MNETRKVVHQGDDDDVLGTPCDLDASYWEMLRQQKAARLQAQTKTSTEEEGEEYWVR